MLHQNSCFAKKGKGLVDFTGRITVHDLFVLLLQDTYHPFQKQIQRNVYTSEIAILELQQKLSRRYNIIRKKSLEEKLETEILHYGIFKLIAANICKVEIVSNIEVKLKDF